MLNYCAWKIYYNVSSNYKNISSPIHSFWFQYYDIHVYYNTEMCSRDIALHNVLPVLILLLYVIYVNLICANCKYMCRCNICNFI